jgi:hypothetical protein
MVLNGKYYELKRRIQTVITVFLSWFNTACFHFILVMMVFIFFSFAVDDDYGRNGNATLDGELTARRCKNFTRLGSVPMLKK